MTRPSSSRRRDPRSNWSLRYIELQDAYDKRVHVALQQALDDADVALTALEGKTGIGAAVQRAQIAQTRAVLTEILRELFLTVGGIVREGQKDAAQAAVEAMQLQEQPLVRRLFPDAASLERFRDGQVAKARRNANSMVTRILKTERPLARRLYQSQAFSNGLISRVINSHLARGSSAAALAKDVRGLVNPNTPGGVSYVSKRLARTEINNAFHAQSIEDMQNRPWVNQVEWHLSKSHPPRQPPCQCEIYARIELFQADQVPAKPHPQCLCYLTPHMMGEAEFTNALLSGQFQSWIDENK